MWCFPKGRRNILQRFMNCAARSWILVLLQVKTILSMMGIIILLLIRIISYRYWMILSRISYGCATKASYDTILCSQYLKARILILQHKWRAISGMEDFQCEALRKAAETFYSGSNFSARSWILILLQVKTILSMMVIIIALSVRIKDYR